LLDRLRAREEELIGLETKREQKRLNDYLPKEWREKVILKKREEAPTCPAVRKRGDGKSGMAVISLKCQDIRENPFIHLKPTSSSQ